MTWLCNRRKGRKRKRRGCFGIECKSIIVIKEIFKRVGQHWYEGKLNGKYPWQVKYGKQRKYVQQQIMKLQKSKKSDMMKKWLWSKDRFHDFAYKHSHEQMWIIVNQKYQKWEQVQIFNTTCFVQIIYVW